MKLSISNIQFKDLPRTVKVPVDVQPIRDWLEDYKMSVPETEDGLLYVYIRTWLFQNVELTYDFKEINTVVIHWEEQPLCIDASDHNYDKYRTVDIEVNWPMFIGCEIDEHYISVHKDDTDTMVFDYLQHHLPVTIHIKHFSDILKAKVAAALSKKLSVMNDYIDDLLTENDEPGEDGATAENKAEFNINEFIKDLDNI